MGSLAATVALGAATAPEASSGKLLGLFTGLAIFAVVAYQVFRLCAPLARERDEGFTSALVMLGLLLVVKSALLFVFPGFHVDIGTYEAWALSLVKDGPSHVYRAGYFLDYPPGYLYVLWAAGLLAGMVHATGTGLRVIVESPALIADLALAAVVFAWVRRSARPAMALPAMLMVAFNPAMLFDSVVWGQTDSVFTLVMWLTIVALIAEEYEAGFALAAVSVLVKPQGLMLLPVVGLWTLLKTDWRRWWRAALAFSAVFVIGILPFQLGHRWNWIIRLYGSGAAYYHETSVNAFNLMALIGGIRQPDSGTVFGVSFFALGMSLLVPLFGFIAWVLWRRRTPSGLFYASFLALFGFFMFAPRMHERYLYPALVFAIPLALESPQMLVVFGVLTLTCLFNLAYVLHALDTVVFMKAHDPLALACAGVNLALFALAVRYGITELGSEASEKSPLADLIDRFKTPAGVSAETAEESDAIAPPAWIRLDTLVLGALVIAAAATRFWHLGRPPEIVFD